MIIVCYAENRESREARCKEGEGIESNKRGELRTSGDSRLRKARS